jgi:prephenate dehydratase
MAFTILPAMPSSPGRSAPGTQLGRIGFLGPAGTFSEEALRGEADLATCELVAYPTIGDAVAAAASGEVDAAFVPLENSIEGAISATLDQLIFGEGLLVQREVVADIHLDLLGLPGADRDKVSRVLSYPAALAQCREHLLRELPGVRLQPTTSTAEAARLVAQEHLVDALAVAPPSAGRRYGLETVTSSIEDRAGNQTRFVLVAPGIVPAPSGHDRTLVVCFQPADRPGSLLEILGQFAARSLNLTRIESRPTKQALGDYCFVIEVEGHIQDDVLGDCLITLHARLGEVRFLGSYPVSGEPASRQRAELDRRTSEARAWLASLRARIVSAG